MASGLWSQLKVICGLFQSIRRTMVLKLDMIEGVIAKQISEQNKAQTSLTF